MTLNLKHALTGAEVPTTRVEGGATIQENQFVQFNWIGVYSNTPEELRELTIESISYLQFPPETDFTKGIVLDLSPLVSSQIGVNAYVVQWLPIHLLAQTVNPIWVGIFDPIQKRVMIPWHDDYFTQAQINSFEFDPNPPESEQPAIEEREEVPV